MKERADKRAACELLRRKENKKASTGDSFADPSAKKEKGGGAKEK